MADDQNIFGGRLSLEDGFSNSFQRFVNGVLTAENKFKQFASSIVNSNQKIVNETSKTSQQVDRIAQRFISKGDTVANAINKANDRVRENQEKTVEGLAQKYIKLGMTIQEAYAKAKQESNKIWNGNTDNQNPNSNREFNMNDGFKDFAQSFLSGGFGGVLGKLGLIGSAAMAGVSLLKTIDSALDTGFDILNKASDGLLSIDGIKEGLQQATTFEQGRVALDTLMGGEAQGLKYYQMGTKIAKDTPYSETDLINIEKKLGATGIQWNENDLMAMLDTASVKPELGAEHIAFSIVDAMQGRVSSLKMNYGISNEKLQEYLKTLKKTDKSKYNQFKNALNKEGTAKDEQQYFNLIIDYIKKQTNYNGLTKEYANTLGGQVDRLGGLWETLKVDLLGLDANNTGKAKDGITVFSSVKKAIDGFSNWLEKDNTQLLLNDVGEALGKAINSFATAFEHLLENVDWEKVGNAFEEIADSASQFVEDFIDSGKLKEIEDSFSTAGKMVLNNKMIKTETDANLLADLAKHDYLGYAADWFNGKQHSFFNSIGMEDHYQKVQRESEPTLFYYDSNIIKMIEESNMNKEDANNLTQLIKSDDKPFYEIHVNAGSSIDEILNALRKELEDSQANRK
ncbi:hypothetical protein [Clostridium butyricum]|uniref:hypothetical protein n=1 Tax=Clostridium butyricum TaxID=1492 RepID=UPI002AB2D7D2|nr:hypothetical protein [Clostridium butyricum]